MAASFYISRHYPSLTLCKNIYYDGLLCTVSFSSPQIIHSFSTWHGLVNIQMTPQKLALGKNII